MHVSNLEQNEQDEDSNLAIFRAMSTTKASTKKLNALLRRRN